MSIFHGIKWIDTLGIVNAFKNVDGKPRVSSMPYTYDISEGNVSGHTSWSKMGYNGALVADTEADLWSATGVYTFMTSEMGLEVISSSSSDDGYAPIKGDATGNTVQSDAGGTTTTLVDADVDFTASTAVAIGDCVLLDPHGTSPEWGYVTGVATHTLTVANGFSSGGSGASRYYAVVDQSLSTGAQAVKIEYLDDDFATHTELCLLNGTVAVATVNTNYYRIQSFRVIAAGSGFKAAGNLSLRETDDSPTYSYISAGYTRARNAQYTVPASKTLYIISFTAGYGYKTNSTHYCRIYTRANIETSTGFHTGTIFFPYTEVIVSNNSQEVIIGIPTKLPEKTDIRISAVATYAGAATIVLRGWIE